MKISRWAATAFAATAAFAVGCGSTSSCGGTNLDATTKQAEPVRRCGPGTVEVNGVCTVPAPAKTN